MSFIWFQVYWLAEHAPKSGIYIFTKFGREPIEGVKITLNLNFLNRRRVLRKNQGGQLNREKTAQMSYTWLWLHWLAESTPISGQYQFTKFGRLTGRDPKEVAKLVLNLLILTRRPVLRNYPRGPSKLRKTARMPYIWLWVHWLVEHSSKFVKYEFIRLGHLTARDPKKGAKIILKFFFLS